MIDKKFRVIIEYSGVLSYDIVASNPQEAEEKALDKAPTSYRGVLCDVNVEEKE